MSNNKIDAWLRGSFEGIAPPLQPAAAALIQASEDIERLCLSLTQEELWREIAGAASVGFHLRHLAGATDRLFTYARGDELSEQQMATAKLEKQGGTASASELVAMVRLATDNALNQLRNTPPESLYLAREVGRAKLPSTTAGLLYHAADHAQRHCGQIVTTLKFLRGQ